MLNFLWNPAWGTGIPLIDEQHRELFHRMDKLAASLTAGGDQAETGKVLLHLQEYVVFHFDAEQSLMVQAGFPGYSRHRGIHEAMKERVEELVEAHRYNQDFEPMEVMEFLLNWLLNHIDKEDRGVALFLKNQPPPT